MMVAIETGPPPAFPAPTGRIRGGCRTRHARTAEGASQRSAPARSLGPVATGPSDSEDVAVYPPEVFLEPWTRRRLRLAVNQRDDLTVLLGHLGRQRRVTRSLDPVVERYLVDTTVAWVRDTLEHAPQLTPDSVHALAEAALHAGYLLGRLLVGTADLDQRWSAEGDRDELRSWLEQVVPMIDWSGIGELIGAAGPVSDATAALVTDMLREHGLGGDAEVVRRAPVFVDNGLCVALVEHSATRPLADHVWVDLTVLEELLPEDTVERVWIGEALGCLLARVDGKGRCSESDLREAADELGGERGHRYFRQLRDWGVIDYSLTRSGRSTVRVSRHRALRAGPLAR